MKPHEATVGTRHLWHRCQSLTVTDQSLPERVLPWSDRPSQHTVHTCVFAICVAEMKQCLLPRASLCYLFGVHVSKLLKSACELLTLHALVVSRESQNTVISFQFFQQLVKLRAGNLSQRLMLHYLHWIFIGIWTTLDRFVSALWSHGVCMECSHSAGPIELSCFCVLLCPLFLIGLLTSLHILSFFFTQCYIMLYLHISSHLLCSNFIILGFV